MWQNCVNFALAISMRTFDKLICKTATDQHNQVNMNLITSN